MIDIKEFSIYLIRASKYDDDGFVLRHWKGILPSNTLACMYGLTNDVKERGVLGKDLEWKIEIIDESVQKVEVKKIVRESKKRETKVIVCLVGVQSNQFPRASDLALEFRKGGVDVLIGGFHVSGSIAMLSDIPVEIKELISAGVSVVAGEAEGHWEGILQDAYYGRLKQIYNLLSDTPDIRSTPMPLTNKKYLQRFISSNYTTLDCGRGCPFNCSFCSVINVHGRKMRCRDVGGILNLIRKNYKEHNISFYFFTDDNFCRNKNWEAIFNGLIQLRTEENIPVEFMMQADTQSYKVSHFVEKAKQAGCIHVFIGMESLNPRNLHSVGKKQNQVDEFKNLISAYRTSGIDTHIAYMIGFPFDTPESIKEDIENLKNEIEPEQVSFFMMTPLPGSQDHVQFKQNKIEIDPDLNKYDSFHVTIPHPNMTNDELQNAFNDAWKSFYSLENMEAILNRVSPQNYWDVFMKFIFYKNSILVENKHPMTGGIIRLKDRLQRRPGYLVESSLKHFKRRIKDITSSIKHWKNIIFEMEELWLRTRPRSILERRVIDELQTKCKYAKQWRELKLIELKIAYCHALLKVLDKTTNLRRWRKYDIPSNFWMWLKQRNFFSMSLTYSRKSYTKFWFETKDHLIKGRIHYIDLVKLHNVVAQESCLFINFMTSLFAWLIPHLFRGTFSDRKQGLLVIPLED